MDSVGDYNRTRHTLSLCFLTYPLSPVRLDDHQHCYVPPEHPGLLVLLHLANNCGNAATVTVSLHKK